MKSPYKVILYPLRTEKGTAAQADNKYLFVVDPKANKIDIKWAIKEIYKVDVADVNTMNIMGKRRRVRLVEGKRSDWKKAMVTLKEGEVIDMK